MIPQFDDFCLWVYVLVDDMCKELEVQLRRSGPDPDCSPICPSASPLGMRKQNSSSYAGTSG